MQKANRAAVTVGANEWRNAILRTLTGNRSGKEYRVPGTSKMYTASAPGEAPASVTGDLRTSYTVVVISDTEAVVGTPLLKALYLEKGTKVDGTQRIAPRPHFWISYVNNEDKITASMKNAFKGVMNG